MAYGVLNCCKPMVRFGSLWGFVWEASYLFGMTLDLNSVLPVASFTVDIREEASKQTR